ncbi:type VI secretion system membrane subunit TssM [Polymorphobacter fuscus]|uniref:Type VI secretion system membrane subunit TssM n=1 Tax=Sandarakinorhabdus fusca TaxID=1439888 RepID=A0A7C9KJE4_9SPHN|nr:type VI secretion system membrane subunit TssM [Polymorphobacter fuscus]KAB7648275.1 type VI secretion system membrane subunit TssM [Polymorphobacter fuscus]MQT15783.1 type VI secretion system membrane subunit TssM [Polymorphobacter fuscus]
MAAVRKALSNWWVIVIGSALLVSLALFLLAGLLLPSLLGWRWWLIGLVWLAVAIAAGVRFWRRRAAQKSLAEAIAPPDRESEAVTAKMKAALAELAKRGKGALYDLPWYVIIGPPGAGKTTIIKKSGLNLVGDADAIKGVGGTRDCDWWFTDEAVLIDTAGRYTSQDSDASRDARTWAGFLATLRKARPLQPLNGVIVAIGLDEIATVSAEALDRHVVTLRARLAEIGKALAIELPVYVVFTKADLVSGFTEFFEDLSVEGRRSPVGATLPLTAAPDTALLANAYDDAVQALADRVPDRLQSDGDAVRRGAILTLPARLIDLRGRVVRLLDGVFGAGHAAPANMRLRGFYLTSGVQQGTPFDRLIGDLSTSLGRTSRPQSQGARTFFVNRLFKDVIFAEAGLAGPDPKRRRRDRMTRIATFAVIGLMTVAGLAALFWSFVNNRAGQDATAAAAASLAQTAQGLDAGDRVAVTAPLDEVLPLLDGLAATLPYGAAGTPPSPGGLGLYRTRLDGESHRAYADALQRYLLPRLILAAESALRDARDEPVASYEPLKVYLMLGNAAGTRRDNAYILQWLEGDLNNRTMPGPEAEAARGRILVHAKALLADQGRFGRQIAGPLLDAGLVERAQAAVAAMSPADRALALLKQQVSGPESRLVGKALLPGEAEAFGNPADLRAATIPFLFTKAGFQTGFIPRAGQIGALLDKDRWMLGTSAAAQAPLDPQALGAAYAAEYTRRWNDVLALPQPANYAAQPVTLARLANPGGSPLKKLTDEIVANTSGLMPTAKSGNARADAAIGAIAGQARGGPSMTAAATIESNFQMLRQYAGGTGGGITGLLTALGDYQKAVAQAAAGGGGGGGGGGAAAGGGGAAALAGAAVALKVAAANAAAAAPGLASFVDRIASGSSAAAETSRTAELRAAFAAGPAPQCAAVIGTGFPFGTGADLQPMDVTRAAGAMTAFADGPLQPYLRRTTSATRPGWGWVSNEPAVASFQPASARAFERAAEAQALVGGNLVLGLAAGPGVAGPVDLKLSGVPLTLAPTAPAQRFNWSYGGLQSAAITAAGAEVARGDGPWALFRLLAKARKQDLGKGQYRFTFNPTTVLDVSILGGPDPFAADGVFALRCPARL